MDIAQSARRVALRYTARRVAAQKLALWSGEDVPTEEMLQNLLAYLRALHFCHWTAHWQAKGDPQYGDHLLFERLYSGVTDEIDALAEKLVSGYGASAVNAAVQSHLMDRLVAMATDAVPDDLFRRALFMEDALQDALKAIFEEIESRSELSLGMNDFLAAMANTHETHQYLLRQRTR